MFYQSRYLTKTVAIGVVCVITLFGLYSILRYENRRMNTNTDDRLTNIAQIMPGNKEPTLNCNQHSNSPTQTELQNCIKPPNAKTHVICKHLPYTETTCSSKSRCPDCVVPNVVHYVWFGNRKFLFLHYLSVRSVSVYQKPEKIIFHLDFEPEGELWLRILAEVPCIEISHFDPPTHVFGHKITNILHKTDVARNKILLEHGGIYLDSDVIILKSLDDLRMYSYTMGRSNPFELSNGAFLSKPNAPFLKANVEEYKNYDKYYKSFTYLSCKWPKNIWNVGRPDLPIHVEETSMHRPNPWVEPANCMTRDSYDITDNYMLHVHPSKSMSKEDKDHGVDELRVMDTTYGAAARAALFGSQDLVFLMVEENKAKDRKEPKAVLPFND